MKRLVILSFIFINITAFPQDTGKYIPYPDIKQSLGIVYEASSFSFHNFVNSENPSTGMIKNIFLNYNIYISNNFQLSFKAGYGWDKYSTQYSSSGGNSETEENTNGIPIECDIKFQEFTGKDSVFEPFTGIGLGFYNYSTKNSYNPSNYDKQEYDTNGFAQYIIFGMNFHMSKRIITSIQFKKIMWNNISTRYNSSNLYYNSSTEFDYAQKSGLYNIALSMGLYYSL
jgi:hypothetical protein